MTPHKKRGRESFFAGERRKTSSIVRPAKKDSRPPARRGAVLVAVMVVLMVCSLLLGAMLRTGREEHQLLGNHQLRLQTIELGQAGVERAAAQLWKNADYRTEVWRISAAELNGRDGAAVKIDVEAIADRPERRRIRVEVNYPSTGERRVQHRCEAFVDLPSEQ